jgi:uncharacterized protein YdaU (DUF1376 family)
MNAKSDMWMPLYIGDYLADTMHLTCEQSGAYLHLIMHYWRAGSLPDNDVALAQIARLPAKSWQAHKATISAFFGPGWTHKRINAERQRTNDVKERYHERAVKAAQARHKHTPSIATSTATSNGHASLKDRNSQSHGSNEPIASSNEDVSAEPTAKPLSKREVIDAWQQRMVPQGFPAIRKMTGQRERQLAARLRDSTLDEWLQAMGALERSAFCRGENDRGWRADFDFLLQPKSFTKLLEGAYDH